VYLAASPTARVRDGPVHVPCVMSEKATGSSAAQRFGSACIGAAVAEITTLPVDAAKVRLQMQVTGVRAATAVGTVGHSSSSTAAIAAAGSLPCKPPKYTGLLQAMYRIGLEEGPASLWRGVEPALVRQCSYTGMSFVLYQPVRDLFAGDTPSDQIPFYKVRRHCTPRSASEQPSFRAAQPRLTTIRRSFAACSAC
jgi:hypothetical protein